MTPDAKLRMDVYQEGQRAAKGDLQCPYTDWRAGTWKKGFDAARAHYEWQCAQPEPIEHSLADELRDESHAVTDKKEQP